MTDDMTDKFNWTSFTMTSGFNRQIKVSKMFIVLFYII